MSNSAGYFFGKIPTLSTVIWSAEKVKTWKWGDNRYLEAVMQRFVVLNQKNFRYLGLDAVVIECSSKPAIQITTSQYVGAIPIISPKNGKTCGDLVVTGRFGENVGEIISLLDETIRPEYSIDLKLTLDTQMTPPIFIECCKYIDAYQEAVRYKWRKFDNVLRSESKPSGSTLWSEYAIRTSKNPLEFATYKNKANILSTSHSEWHQLNYVLQLAIAELESIRVPMRTRAVYAERIGRLKAQSRNNVVEYTTSIKQRMSDPLAIKNLKSIANLILQNKSYEQLAWRMNYSEFFERYVQYIMNNVARKKGARTKSNPHFQISTTYHPAWGLSYIEPDLVLELENKQVMVDAKYKSHIFNWENGNDELKETFRHDLHQILAYCSFSSNANKMAILVYPYTDVIARKMYISNPITHIENMVYLLGIPIDSNRIPEIEEQVSKIISFD